ncbi:MAG TPA: xanthine dehydrogenase family protein molybdopterin-binding subunit [Rhodopila sp.]|uniref:xanthine dehydrogenase family protein molybdopterin-binding subunit n=1 Tax=Rhodopila sp. TaxID=2480087 RepID=UPI002B639B01|nr:xanthine dehydrogenase family protein molybdopterin-binding subunit [Rhodopila sp.]HVY15270.1 xanthine dehydrogenase family protein molybdopterin-binding subunit [Rhodopila sp.]
MGLIGQPLRRLEDARFLTGHGTYVEDVNLPGQAWGVFIRSPHAHATIDAIDTTGATAIPGVVGIYTYPDIAGLGHLPCATSVATDAPMHVPPRPALANGRVRHVGDPVAFIIAETPQAARNASEMILVSYTALPCVVDAVSALAADAPAIWDFGNESYRFRKGDAEAVRDAFAAAAHVVAVDIVNNRLVIAPLENRAAIGSWNDGRYELAVSAASVHAIRDQLADSIFGCPRDDVRVWAPDVGGGFGIKNCLYPEYVMLLWAARALGRPVKWIEDRTEDFLAAAQGRDNITHARLALDANGTFLGLDVETKAGLGAYMSGGGPGSSTNAPAAAMGGGYVIPAIHMDVRAAFTNQAPIDAYRGAGKPEANYIIERLIDAAAAQCGFDRIELRRRNLIGTFPYRKALGTLVDCGRFALNIDDVLAQADAAGFAARRAASEARGLLRGLGLACFLETARGAPNEGAEIKFHPGGTISLHLGTQSNGMGHETSYKQIAADLFGLPLETFTYVQADTATVREGNGHGGARSMHQGGSALHKAATTVLEKARPIAATLLQAQPDELAYADGVFSCDGRSVDLLAVAKEASLDTYVWNLLDIITIPNGCHIAEVEVDPETGLVMLVRYSAVDDYGTLINPLLTQGQVQGGLAQGIGQALTEQTVYDPVSGQMLTASFMDYQVPRAIDLPDLDVTLTGVPTAGNPLGVKGAGQAGAIGAPPTIVSAVLDALRPLGVTHIDMPATPERVWRAIESARSRP